MKKVFFRQNKRILATVCSAAILFGSFACLGSAQVSAETTKPSLSGEVTYDFENGSDYLDFGIQYNKTLGEVSVVDDGTGNKCLKLYNACTWEGMIVNFPYVLENNTEYVISYKVRSDEGVKVRQDGNATAKYTAGIYVGKSTGVTESGVGLSNDEAKRKEVKDYLNYRLSTLYGTGTGQYEQIPTAWTTQKKTVKTSDSAVDENFKYLCFNFVATDRKDSNGYSTLYIDDIHIQKISTDSAEYNFEDGRGYLNFGIQHNQNSADVAVVDDAKQDGNKCLRLYNSNAWVGMLVNFPYELKNNTSYRISYRIRSDEMVKVREDQGAANVNQAAGIFAGKSTGITSTAGDKVDVTKYIKNHLAYLYDYSKASDRVYVQLPKEWTTQEWTFTTGDSTVDSDYKYLALNFYPTANFDSKGYATLYIDDIKIERVVSLSFGEDADTITAAPGSKVALPTPKAKLGYTFDGWYDADKNPLGNAGTEIICPDVDTTYSARWEKSTSCYVDFEDGKFDQLLSTGSNTPEVTDDPDGSSNKVLMTNGAGEGKESKYSLVIPVELENNTYYTVSFRYKAKFAEGKELIQLDVTQGTEENRSYAGSYVSLANSNGEVQQRLMRLLDGGNADEIGNWDVNKVRNTDWKTCTYKILANESSTYAMLNLIFYWNEPTESAIYFDNISIQKTPTATFVTGDGATSIDSITENPGTVITPGCPIRAGYTFKGWYVNGEYAGFDKLTMPKENVTYTAEWKRVLSVGNVDADENNIINGSDLTQLKKILLGSVTEYEITLADCTGNGTVDILDLVRLKKHLADKNITLGKTVDGATGYQLVWNEEFDGSALDSNTFIANQIQGNVDGITFTDEQVDVSDGTLKLWAVQNEDGTVACAKGVTTDNTMNFKHGYVEVRAKLPYLGQGEWPAIWSTSSSAKLAGTQNERSLEIDLAENMGGGILKAQIHNWGPDRTTGTDDYMNLITDNTNLDMKKSSNEFHTYGMLWTKTGITFYLDGTKYASYTFPNDNTMSAEVANQLISLRINNGFNTDSKMELSGLNNNAVEVDYVRLYQIPEKSILISK